MQAGMPRNSCFVLPRYCSKRGWPPLLAANSMPQLQLRLCCFCIARCLLHFTQAIPSLLTCCCRLQARHQLEHVQPFLPLCHPAAAVSPSVRRALPPVGTHSTVLQLGHTTTVWLWLNTVVLRASQVGSAAGGRGERAAAFEIAPQRQAS